MMEAVYIEGLIDERASIRAARRLATHVLSRRSSVVAVDALPGVGKTTFALNLKKILQASGVTTAIVGTDLDLLPRAERGDRSMTDFFTQNLTGEVLKDLNHNRVLYFNAYQHKTGTCNPLALSVPAASRGVTLIEGLRSIEGVLKVSPKAQVTIVRLVLPEEVRLERNFQRDTKHRGLNPDFVRKRIDQHRRELIGYYKDLDKEIRGTTLNQKMRPSRMAA